MFSTIIVICHLFKFSKKVDEKIINFDFKVSFVLYNFADVDECSTEEHDCDKATQSCRNMPGSFTCDCKKGFKRDGDKCMKKEKKGKTKMQNTKTEEQQLEEELAKGNFYTELQMKLGSVLYAVFFACVVAAVMKRSRLAIVILTLAYGCILWFLRK